MTRRLRSWRKCSPTTSKNSRARSRRTCERREYVGEFTNSPILAMQFESVIGLEIHAQLLTASKIFCGCSTAFGAQPNTHICPVCLGLPGALPVLNAAAVDEAACAALALGCTIHERSIFARKNYFYPDL